MKTKHQIIDDVVAHVKEQGGRAVVCSNDCVYLDEENARSCAVGMALEDKHRWGAVDGDVYVLEAELDIEGTTLEEQLKPEYRGHSVEFWKMVQELHDDSQNWTKDNIPSGTGKLVIKRLKEKCQ